LEVLGFTPTLGQSGVATPKNQKPFNIGENYELLNYILLEHFKVMLIIPNCAK
jgi:hypothetical protein